MDCPTCGHAVRVVGDTTQHYEPIGCLQIVDDHQVCDEEIQSLRRIVRFLHPDAAPDPLTAKLVREGIGEHDLKRFRQVVGGSNGTS